MRVIAGQAKGMTLLSVKSAGLRPVLDQVKEALFNVLGDFVAGARCADLFAGTGALGIEALSRGAQECIFIEKTPKCLHVLHRNLDRTGLAERARVWKADVFRCGPRFSREEVRLNLLLAGPPYAIVRRPDSWRRLLRLLSTFCDRHVLHEGAWVVLEHRAGDLCAPHVPGLEVAEQRLYGQTELTFWQRPRTALPRRSAPRPSA